MISIPILMYHQVTPAPSAAFRKYAITVEDFAFQMRALKVLGYTPISLDSLVAQRTTAAPLPRRPIVLTFDDGFQDCLDYAVPILQGHGFTAIFYLVTGLMGKTAEWLPQARLPLMDWSAARRLDAEGFQCGAHTVTHPHLTRLNAEACRREMVDARRAMEDHLGRAVVHFAYPYGDQNACAREMARQTGFHSAVSVRTGLSTTDDDLFALHRVPVNGTDSRLGFLFRLRYGRTHAELAYRWAQRLSKRVRRAPRPRAALEE